MSEDHPLGTGRGPCKLLERGRRHRYIEVLSILLSIFAYFGIYCGIIILHMFLVLLDRICVVFCVQLAVVF